MPTAIEKRLQAMRLTDPDARKVFDAFRDYEKNRGEVTVETLRLKTGLRPKGIRAVLGDLEQLELGELIVGRRGGKTRFRWFGDFLEVIPGPVKGEPQKGEAAAAIAKSANLMMQLICNLGDRREARLLLPANATQKDLQTVVRHLEKTLEAAQA